MDPDLLQRLVDFFLNTYAEVEDPVAALRYRLGGDPLLTDRMLGAWRRLAKNDPVRFLAVNRPEAGDLSIRQWITEVYLAN
jgi:hypothetical protein